MVTFVRNCLVKITLRLFQPLSVAMTMVPRHLRQFRRLLQIKKSITNAPRVLLFPEQRNYTYQSITNCTCEKRLVSRDRFLGHLGPKLKYLLKFNRKKSNNQPLVSFIHNKSEITTWTGYNFKTKSTKSQATFLRKTYFFEFQALDH